MHFHYEYFLQEAILIGRIQTEVLHCMHLQRIFFNFVKIVKMSMCKVTVLLLLKQSLYLCHEYIICTPKKIQSASGHKG